MQGTSPDLPKKHVFWETYSVYSPNGLTKFAVLRSKFATKFTGCPPGEGGSARGRTRRFGLHEGVFE